MTDKNQQVETKQSIEELRNFLFVSAMDASQKNRPYEALAFATGAVQLSGEDFQTQRLYEVLYWAHHKNGNFFDAKTYFNMAVGYEQLKPKYLEDYKYFYPLPKISIIGQNKISDSKYPDRLIEYVGEVEPAGGDWLVFLPAGYDMENYALMTMVKMTADNHKYCVTFSDKKCWAIKRDSYNALRNRGVKLEEMVERCERNTYHIHCGPAKVIKK